MNILSRLRVWLFGTVPGHGGHARRIGTQLITQIAHGGLRPLSSEELVELVEFLLTNSALRRPLRGNTRFLQSVTNYFRRRGKLTPAQRTGVLNILEKAYPHNLAAELHRFV